jgi:hypothetical protein
MTIIFKDLLVAGALWLAALSAVQAAGKLGGSSGADHASAAPTCGYECPVLAGDGGPGGAGDNNGRSMASATGRSGQIPTLWRPVLAGDGGPGSPTDGTGRSAALSPGGGEYRVASIKAGTGDF